MTSDPLGRYLTERFGWTEKQLRLRPMQPGEILDLSVRMYQTLGWTMLRLTALPTLLCLSAVAFVLEFSLPGFFRTTAPGDTAVQIAEAASTLAIAFFVAGPLFLVGLSLSSAIVVSLVSDAMLGNLPDPSAAWRAAQRVFPRMFALNVYELVLGWSGAVLGILALMASALIPEPTPGGGLWPAFVVLLGLMGLLMGSLSLPLVLARHALSAPLVVLEGLSPVAAARRSAQLLKGSPWHPSGYPTVWSLFVVLALLLGMLLLGVTASLALLDAFERVRTFMEVPVVGAVVAKAVQLLPWYLAIASLVPVWCTTVTILYYERRIRLEGYDIEALARDVWRADKTSRFEL